MAEQTLLPEAPVSWTVRYRSTQGFDCMLTLRGTDAAAVLRQAHGLLEAMCAAGAAPVGPVAPTGPMGPAGAGPAGPTSAGDESHNGTGNGNGNSAQGPGWCAAHGVQMRRYEKEGRAWYAHRAQDGSWCHGRA